MAVAENALIMEFFQNLSTHWIDIRDYFNSQFMSSVVGALAGAGFGAWGAQRIAERAKRREELLKQIRNTNTAIMLAFSICNSVLSLKKQHVKSIKENFEEQRSAFLVHQKKRQSGQIGHDVLFYFAADFQTLLPPEFPIEIMQSVAFEKLSLSGRPISLVITLTQTLQSLKDSLEKRNQLIESFKSNPLPPDNLAAFYFGVQLNGNVDRSYADSIEAIYTQTDDAIYFSHLLISDLRSHGQELTAAFKNTFKKGVPSINEADFSKAEQAGLLPDTAHYADWKNMFIKQVKPQSFLERLSSVLLCKQ